MLLMNKLKIQVKIVAKKINKYPINSHLSNILQQPDVPRL